MDDMAFRIKADYLKGLAHPIRLQIIEYLKNGEASVGKLEQDLGVKQSNLSRHLALLRGLGILEARQEKTSVYYAIHDHDIFKILRPVAELLKNKLIKSGKILETLGKE
ncbi:MAG: ArsR/SmtB family transcription factor [Candidatus Omnitrophota bacterium]